MTTYVAKQNLPDGIMKGDKIINFINTRTNKKVLYDPSNEPNFFIAELPMKYKIGEQVCLNNKNSKFIACDKIGFRIYKNYPVFQNNRPYNIIGYLDNKYIIENDSNRYGLFSEKDIKKYETYYFVNSKGKICNTVIGMDPDADSFRISIGNYHNDKDKCGNYLINLIK